MSTLQPPGGFTTRWVAMAAAMISLTIATIIGNAAVLIALKRARTAPSHYPLASLAAADLLVGLFVLPMAAARELFVFQLDQIICSCWKILDVMCCTASILSLCCLGWERWCGITAPLARARRARQARLFAGLVWPTALSVALPTAFISSPKNEHLQGKGCPDNTNVGYVLYSATLSFYLPAIVMLVLYARILCALSVPPQIRAHRGRMPCTDNGQGAIKSKSPVTKFATSETICPAEHPETNNNVSSIISRQQRASRTIFRLMGLFLFCWTPFFVTLPVDSFCDCVWDSVWQWSTWLGFTNSALNPLVYAAASPSVRRALRASLASSGKTDVPSTSIVRSR